MTTSAQPLVSIILPVYNGSRYLRESIQSCLRQTYPHWELIVVDDASTDATPALIAEHIAGDTRIRIIRHESNRRLPGALNTGFSQAHGAYLTWTSDDNRYRPEALQEMVRVLQREPALAFVYADYDVIDEAGRYVKTTRVRPPIRLIQGYEAVPCFLFRRSVYEQVGPYADDLFLAEDYDYLLRIVASQVPMFPIHQVVYEYRRHAQSLTDVHRGRTFAAAEQALLRNLPQMTWADRAVLGEAYLYLASLASWRGDRRAALRYTIRAARYTPGHVTDKLGSLLIKRIRRA